MGLVCAAAVLVVGILLGCPVPAVGRRGPGRSGPMMFVVPTQEWIFNNHKDVNQE